MEEEGCGRMRKDLEGIGSDRRLFTYGLEDERGRRI